MSLTRGRLAVTERQPSRWIEWRPSGLRSPTRPRTTSHCAVGARGRRGRTRIAGQLIEGLIENAIKYNLPDGWIDVRVRRAREQGILEVAHPGPRLAQDQLTDLLEPFRRADRQRVGAGSDLGLSIVRTIVVAHGGQLAPHALPDGALRVTVTLPSSPMQPGTDAATQRPLTHRRH